MKVIKKTVNLFNEDDVNDEFNTDSKHLTKNPTTLQFSKSKEVKLNKICKCDVSDKAMKAGSTCGIYCKLLSPSEQKDLIFSKASCASANSYIGRHNRVVPAQWWRVWCDYVNIEFKSLSEHFASAKASISRNEKFSTKEALTTMKISEESDVEFDIKSINDQYLNENGESSINFQNIVSQNNENLNFVSRMDNKSFNSISKLSKNKIASFYKENICHYKQNSDCSSPKLSDIVYTRPGKIENKHLVVLETPNSTHLSCHYSNNNSQNTFFELKPNLQEYYDYVLVPKDSWSLFSTWYGYDYEVIYDPYVKFNESTYSNN